MSEVDNNASIGSKAVSYLAFPTVLSAPDIVRLVQYKKSGAIKGFEKLEEKLLKDTSKDVFQRSNILMQNYDAYKAATKIPLKDRFLNLFRNSANKLKPKEQTIKNLRKELSEGGIKTVTNVAEAGFANNFKTLFKNGMKDKLGIAITAALAVPELIQNVVPKFKEEGFVSGMKALGKFAIKTTADFFSFVSGSALGTVIGSVLIPIPGIGAAIGKTFFGILGSSIMNGVSTKVLNKVLKEDKAEENEIQIQQELRKPMTQQEALEAIKSYKPNFQQPKNGIKFNMQM